MFALQLVHRHPELLRSRNYDGLHLLSNVMLFRVIIGKCAEATGQSFAFALGQIV